MAKSSCDAPHTIQMERDSNSESDHSVVIQEDATKDENNLTSSKEGGVRAILHTQEAIRKALRDHRSKIFTSLKFLMVVGYCVYLGFAMKFEFGQEASVRLLGVSLFAVVLVSYKLIKRKYGDVLRERCAKPVNLFTEKHWRILKWTFAVVTAVSLVLFLALDIGRKRPQNLFSLIGFFFFILLGFLYSEHPSKVRWRPVLWGLGIALAVALLVLRTRVGLLTFQWLGLRVQEFISFSSTGAQFVFGQEFQHHFFAFVILPMIVFTCCVSSLLYYMGVIQAVIRTLAWVMQITMATTAAESLVAAANIFVGLVDPLLMIRPLIVQLTKSEMFASSVVGMATMTTSILAVYIAMGIPAQHLLTTSIIAAPCGLAMAKLAYPETERSRTTAKDVSHMEPSPYRNMLAAMAGGASQAIIIVAGIAVNLIAFISMLECVNSVLRWLGARAGLVPPEYPELTFQLICSYVLWPCAYLIGLPLQDCRKVAELIGIRTFINEFVAYIQLSNIVQNNQELRRYNGSVEYLNGDVFLSDINVTLPGGVLEDRSVVLATYALGGFANFGSMGMIIAGISAIAPSRRTDITLFAFKSMIIGALTNLMCASIAGILYDPEV